MKDFSLWAYVKRSVTPFGQPRGRSEPRLIAYVEPNAIDLHGYTVEAAYAATSRAIERHAKSNTHTLIVVTGKSGEICREFPEWARLHPAVRSCRTMNGGGAFELRLS